MRRNCDNGPRLRSRCALVGVLGVTHEDIHVVFVNDRPRGVILSAPVHIHIHIPIALLRTELLREWCLPSKEINIALRNPFRIHRSPRNPIPLNHGANLGGHEPRAESLVLAHEADPKHTVPLVPADFGAAGLGLDADDTGLDLRRRAEVITTDFHDVRDAREELDVDGETGVEGVAGASDQTEGKFALNHENSHLRRIGHGEEFEDEG